MPVFLEVLSGPNKGNKTRLDAGRIVHVGRTERAELVFSEDSHMSGVHFSVVTDGRGCRLTDLNSRNGTLVNGQNVNTAVLGNGDTIVAGETIFAVRVEVEKVLLSTIEAGTVTKPAPAELLSAIPQERFLDLLRGDFQPLFAILDAARDIRILALLVHYKEECQSLYEGAEGAKLAQVAPYLVRLLPGSKLLEALVKEGWGKSWGVYLSCASNLQEVRRHLRHFLQVKLPDGEQVYFRFYDPRVMRVFLPTCIAEETNQFFGGIQRYVLEGEEPDQLWVFTNAGRGVMKKIVPLVSSTSTDDKAGSVTPSPFGK